MKNPILIGGYALEYHYVRKGHDYDFIVSNSDFQKLRKTYGNPDDKGNIWLDLKGRHGGVDIFSRLYHFDHKKLSNRAIQEKNFMVACLDDLFILESLYHMEDNSKKIRRNMKLIMTIEL